MRFQFIYIILILAMGCSKSNTEAKLVELNLEPKPVKIQSIINSISDTLSYVGYINKFEDNNSFYTDLYFVDNFNYERYNEIIKMCKEVVYSDEEMKRTKGSIENVGYYFDLRGLTTISLFDEKNQKLATGKLSHVEYVEDMIEGRFVAVFDVNNQDISDHKFCIGNSDWSLSEIDFSIYENKTLQSDLIDYLKLNTDHIWSVKQYKLNNQTIYSTISADTTAYIIETLNQKHNILYKSSFNEYIHGLTMISKKINNREILLIECGMPETDMTWRSVLTFNGKIYEVSENHKISHVK